MAFRDREAETECEPLTEHYTKCKITCKVGALLSLKMKKPRTEHASVMTEGSTAANEAGTACLWKPGCQEAQVTFKSNLS